MSDNLSPKKSKSVWAPLISIIIFIAGIGIGVFIQPYINKSKPLDKYIEREDPLDEIISLVQQEYVDDVSKDSLYMDAVNGILSRLDPHTVYIPSSQLAQANEILEGSGKGIGIDYFFSNDTLLVTGLEQGGPAEKADIRIGDKIVSVNGKKIAGPGATEDIAIKAFRSSSSDSLLLTIARANIKQPFSVWLLKDILHYSSVNSSYLLEDGSTGYIKMSIFSANSYNDFATALEKLISSGMRQLIFDLRGNTGGYLTEAISITDELLDKEKLIVYTKDKKAGREDYVAAIDGLFEKGKLAILIDDNSASASEVLAGAVQDWDRGLIIGNRSYGKGLIQEQYELSDGSAIRLTTSRYYTPTGRSIQTPYELSGTIGRNNDVALRDSEIFYSFLNKRKLYGNGGITPDVTVQGNPKDKPSEHLLEAVRNSYIEDFSNQYYFKYGRDTISSMKPTVFLTQYQVGNRELNLFREFLLKNNALLVKKLWSSKVDMDMIKKMMKAQYAKLAFGKQTYYQVLNQNDEYIQTALKVISGTDYNVLLSTRNDNNN